MSDKKFIKDWKKLGGGGSYHWIFYSRSMKTLYSILQPMSLQLLLS